MKTRISEVHEKHPFSFEHLRHLPAFFGFPVKTFMSRNQHFHSQTAMFTFINIDLCAVIVVLRSTEMHEGRYLKKF